MTDSSLEETLIKIWSEENDTILVFLPARGALYIYEYQSLGQLNKDFKLNAYNSIRLKAKLASGALKLYGAEYVRYFLGNHYIYKDKPDLGMVASCIEESAALLKTHPLQAYE